MPTREIKTRFKLEGEQQYKKAMSDAAAAIKVLNSEEKLAKAQYEATGDAQEYAAEQTRILKQKIEEQKKAVEAAETAVKKLTDNGVKPNSKEMQLWRTKLNNARTTLTNMETRLGTVTTGLGDEEKGFGKAETAAGSYQEEIEKVNKGINFQNTITAIDNVTEKIEAAAKQVARLARAAIEAAQEAGSWADDVKTAAEQLGIDAETYQSWQYASQFIDTSVSDITRSWQDIQKKLDETNTDYLAQLAELGVATRKSNGEMRSSQDIFWDVIDALHNIKDPTEQARQATAIFGNDWRNLVPLINAGSGAYKDLAKEGREVAVVSNEDVDKLGALDDSFNRLKARAQKLKNEGLAELSPSFISVNDAADKALTAVEDFLKSAEGKAAIEALNAAVQGLVDAFLGEDNGQGTLAAIVDGAKQAVEGFTTAVTWVKDNGEVVKGIILGLAGAWAALKISKDVLVFLQLMQALPIGKLTQLGSLFGGAKAAGNAAAGAAGNAATGAAGKAAAGSAGAKIGAALATTGAKVLGGAGLAAYLIAKPHETANDELDTLYHDDGSLTEAGRQVEEAGSWHERVEELQRANEEIDQLTKAQAATLEEYWDIARGAKKGDRTEMADAIQKAFAGQEDLWSKYYDMIWNRLTMDGQEKLEDLPEGWFSVIDDGLDSEAEAAEEKAGAVAEELEQSNDQLRQLTKEQADILEKYWDVARGAEKADRTQMEDAIWKAFDGQDDLWYKYYEMIWDTLATEGQEQMENLPGDWFTVMDSGLSSEAEAEAKNAEVMGENIAVGLANGMYARERDVAAAAAALANAAGGGVSRTLEIQSPSRVMMRMGAYVGEGFAMGIDESAADVSRAVDRMLSATTRQPAMAFQGVAVSGGRPAAANGRSAAAAAAPDTVRVTLMLDKDVLGDVMAPVVNEKIGARINATRRVY